MSDSPASNAIQAKLHNVAMLLTPPGSAAIAVVRLAGPDAASFVSRHLDKPARQGRCVHANLRDGAAVIDDVVLVAVADQTFDVNLHGGPWVVQSMMALAAREGFEPVDRVTLPADQRWIDAEGMLDREVLAYLPLVRTELAARVLTAQPAAWSRVVEGGMIDRGFMSTSRKPGEPGERFPPFPGVNMDLQCTPKHESSLVGSALAGGTTANPGASADRTVPPAEADPTEPLSAFRAVTREGEAHGLLSVVSDTFCNELQRIAQDRTLFWLLNPPRVAIIGPANVGKSTLANQLFGRERSITADVPGTTRDWVGEFTEVAGMPVLLLDTPGMRTTADEIESAAIQQSQAQITAADLIVLVLDASEPLEADTAALIDRHPNAIRVANKADHTARWNIDRLAHVATVATRGDGVDALRRHILRHFCGCGVIVEDRAYAWTERQLKVVERAFADATLIREIL